MDLLARSGLRRGANTAANCAELGAGSSGAALAAAGGGAERAAGRKQRPWRALPPLTAPAAQERPPTRARTQRCCTHGPGVNLDDLPL